MLSLKAAFPFLLFILFVNVLNAQDSTVTKLKTIAQRLEQYNGNFPRELVFLHTDKPYYAEGDTLHLKAYVLNSELTATAQSGILYLEFINDANNIVQRKMLQLQNGLGRAAIPLQGIDFLSGAYTIRCYTNWMRNFGADKFYQYAFYITSNTAETWLVNAAVKRNKLVGNANLQFTHADDSPVSFQDIQFDVYQGNRRIGTQKIMTGTNGNAAVDFALPDTITNKLQIVAKPAKKPENNVIIPLSFDQPAAADVQFLPEGGVMLASTENKVAFKAVNGDGLGIDVSGTIYNSRHQRAADFKSDFKGIGVFQLLATPGESYTASVRFAGGWYKTFTLPAVKAEGTSLHVNNVNKDSLLVELLCSSAFADNYMLVAYSKSAVYYAGKISLTAGLSIKKIAIAEFPTGIVHLVLLNKMGVPQNERLVFIDHDDDLLISTETATKNITPGDSISLNILVKDKLGNPVKGNFSLALTDDRQIDINKSDNPNIWAAMYLKPELKGYLEEPFYYYNLNGQQRQQAIDRLLLTQGWVNWNQVSLPPSAVFEPEQEYSIHGRVTGFFGKGATNKTVSLMALKQNIFQTTKTTVGGKFTFTSMPAADSLIYNIQVIDKNGNSTNAGLTVDAPFAGEKPNVSNHLKPWFLNTDSITRTFAQSNIKQKFNRDYLPGNGDRMLKEVKVKAKRIVAGSKNLLAGVADQVIDQKEAEAAVKMTLLKLLETKVKGFSEKWPKGFGWYYLNSLPLFTIVDGVALHRSIIPLTIDDYRAWLNYITAEEVKGIEVIRYSPAYTAMYIDIRANPINFSFLEITTRSGHGPATRTATGTYLYKPLSFVIDKQFYEPKYKVKDAALLANDLRSTIYWQPDVVTDNNGKANVSFYAAGQKGTYSIILQGTDLNGHIGYKAGKIKIN